MELVLLPLLLVQTPSLRLDPPPALLLQVALPIPPMPLLPEAPPLLLALLVEIPAFPGLSQLITVQKVLIVAVVPEVYGVLEGRNGAAVRGLVCRHLQMTSLEQATKIRDRRQSRGG